MKDSELNRKAAELLELSKEKRYDSYLAEIIREQARNNIASSTEPYRYVYSNGIEVDDWNPANDPAHARMLLDWVAEEGLVEKFINNLCHIFEKDFNEEFWVEEGWTLYWPMLTSTPRQITEAFCETMSQPQCGHPVSAIVQADEGTAHCGACEREASDE